MALAFPGLVRKTHSCFPLGLSSPAGILENNPCQSAFNMRTLGFYQFSSGMTIWPRYLLTHLMTYEESNFFSE